jgi:hypothetical protein
MLENVTLMEVVGGRYQGSTNVRMLRDVFYSLKNRKFIKPLCRKGDRVSGYHVYRMLAGRYVIFSYDYWSKRDPGIVFEISLVKLIAVEEGYSIEKVKSVKIRADNKSEVLDVLNSENFVKIQEVVSDFMKAVPGYHSGTDLKELSEKIYNDEVVKELLDFVEKYDGKELFYQVEIE